MQITKMHGIGNDYIYIDAAAQDLSGLDLPALARALSDRHFGVGGDGMILILPSERADFHMRMFNSDGSEAEMCGNGLRCFARYVYDHGLTAKTELVVETGAGLMRPALHITDGRVNGVTVNMGAPVLAREKIPMLGSPADKPVIEEGLVVGEREYRITCVSMGNPHCVLFVDDVSDAPVHSLGPLIENHEAFPARTNVEFVQVQAPTMLHMRVWERGSGETLACGTGASASVVAASLTGRAGRVCEVKLPGGGLTIDWRDDGDLLLTGPAVEVFTGEVDPTNLQEV